MGDLTLDSKNLVQLKVTIPFGWHNQKLIPRVHKQKNMRISSSVKGIADTTKLVTSSQSLL